MFDEFEKNIIKEALRKEILSLVADQKHAAIKAGPGKDKSIHELIADLHNQISIRIDIIRKIEE